jgi:enamine deaminase RidA (YjgF/YER057c/UK114 family)
MSEREKRLEELGYPIHVTTPEGSLVDGISIDGDTVYASGQVPFNGDQLVCIGKVDSEVSREEATAAAALCAANVLRCVRKELGSLDAIERVIRITGYVNSDTDFTDQHLVMNGASQLVRDVFGEAGRHARTALGMGQLPLGSAVEVEMIFQRKPVA